MTMAVCPPSFLSLPSRVRDVIYELLLCSGKVIHGKEYRFPPSYLTPKTSGKVESLPFLPVCRPHLLGSIADLLFI
jgi:hypothetical protein